MQETPLAHPYASSANLMIRQDPFAIRIPLRTEWISRDEIMTEARARVSAAPLPLIELDRLAVEHQDYWLQVEDPKHELPTASVTARLIRKELLAGRVLRLQFRFLKLSEDLLCLVEDAALQGQAIETTRRRI